MKKTAAVSSRKVTTLRWVARILGTMLVAMFLFFFIPDIIAKQGLHSPDIGHSVLTMFFLLGQLGILIAWRWEGVGGLLALISMVLAILINLFWVKQGQSHFAFMIWLLPAFLFLYCWQQSKNTFK